MNRQAPVVRMPKGSRLVVAYLPLRKHLALLPALPAPRQTRDRILNAAVVVRIAAELDRRMLPKRRRAISASCAPTPYGSAHCKSRTGAGGGRSNNWANSERLSQHEMYE
jgi:hypothetical protein